MKQLPEWTGILNPRDPRLAVHEPLIRSLRRAIDEPGTPSEQCRKYADVLDFWGFSEPAARRRGGM